jgi:hypothetical protein
MYLERARRVMPPEGNEDVIADIDFALAKALWARPTHHSRAIALARQARDYYRAHPVGALRARRTREAEAWVAEHDRP